MKYAKNKIYKLIIFLLWVSLFGSVYLEYREIKLDDIPITVLNFDIAILEGSGPGARGVFYYDTGQGFNKDEVVVCEYSQNQGKDFEHYSVALVTNKKIYRLRFDPLEADGTVILKNLVVKKYLEEQVNFSQFIFKNSEPMSIENVSTTENSVTVTAKGNDPHFVLVDNFSLYQK